MEQKGLSNWLKLILIGVGICGLIVYFLFIPQYGISLTEQYPEDSYCYWPWLIFLWITGIPCFSALFLGWKIASNIGADRSFSNDNAKYLKWIAWLAAADVAYFFFGNIVLLFINMSHPGVVLLSLMICFAGIAIAVAAAVLSHMVKKAAALQEQSDLTI